MNAVVVKSRYTPEDLLTMLDGENFELVNGELVERVMGSYSGWIAGQIYFLLRAFPGADRTGFVAPSDVSYQCFPDDPTKVRRPDVSFITFDRLPSMEHSPGHCRSVPNLTVEVVSPNDLYSELNRKVEEYLEAGVQLVWVVDPPTHTVQVHRPDGTGVILHESDELSGEDVLPGFTCRVAQIFAEPKPSPTSF